jgi:hypothetical protein
MSWGGRSDYDWRTRLQRAFTQRIYLLDVIGPAANSNVPVLANHKYQFKVMGNSDSQCVNE